LILNRLLRNRGAIKSDRLSMYRAAIQNCVARFVSYPLKIAMPL
jgi:hypothetical protein